MKIYITNIQEVEINLAELHFSKWPDEAKAAAKRILLMRGRKYLNAEGTRIEKKAEFIAAIEEYLALRPIVDGLEV